jgi:hypothetical protein
VAVQVVEGVVYAEEDEESMIYRYYLADNGFGDVRAYGDSALCGKYYSGLLAYWSSKTVVPENDEALRRVPDTWVILARIPLYGKK